MPNVAHGIMQWRAHDVGHDSEAAAWVGYRVVRHVQLLRYELVADLLSPGRLLHLAHYLLLGQSGALLG